MTDKTAYTCVRWVNRLLALGILLAFLLTSVVPVWVLGALAMFIGPDLERALAPRRSQVETWIRQDRDHQIETYKYRYLSDDWDQHQLDLNVEWRLRQILKQPKPTEEEEAKLRDYFKVSART